MKKIRKQLCFILTLLMVVCLFPVMSQAVTALPVTGNNWSLDDDGLLTITNDTGMNDWLNSLNGKFQYNGYVKSIVAGDAVTTISANAFSGLSDLASVTIGTSVTTIGALAFDGCTGLKSLTLPAAVTAIGNSAFNCANLKSVLFKGNTPPNTVGTTVFDTTKLSGIYVPKDSLDSYQTALPEYTSLIKPISVGITKDGATTYYPTLSDAFEKAADGDTVTLLRDITESASYLKAAAGITVTIDGGGYTVTAPESHESIALSLAGTGTVILKNLTLQGGGSTNVSMGLRVGGTLDIRSFGTVTAVGGTANYSYGLHNSSAGTVDITAASASGTTMGCGVTNSGPGTVNVGSAEGGGAQGTGVCNSDAGTINVKTATGSLCGVNNQVTGTVNVTAATGGQYGVYNTNYGDGIGTVNVSSVNSSGVAIYNDNGGAVNAGTSTGTVTGTCNTSIAVVTLNKGDGAACVLDSITVASTGTTTMGKLPSVCKNGEYSDKWYIDSGKKALFTGTTVTGAATLYSNYYEEPVVHHGGGGGGGGSVAASVTTPEITKTVSGNTTTFNIPKAALGLPANGGTDGFKVSAANASISFDKGALATIMDAAGDIKITASKIETANLSEETKQLVGDRPVFNFSITSGNKTISQFGGTVTVSVPYTPKAGEDPNAIVIYYINAEGKLEMVSNCAYNPATGSITFTTDHFSKYAVGYNKVNFDDVAANAWYGDAVCFVAARDITTGTGNGNYSPEMKLTRGQFLVMVMRAYGIEADSASNDNFSDAGNTYYTGYLAAAKSLGITGGIGNNMFAPEKEITRQEMFTLLYNTLDSIDQLPVGTTGNALTSYQDADKIASWAKDAMTLFVGTGTVSGSGNLLNPSDTTNRAQMAQVLYNLMAK